MSNKCPCCGKEKRFTTYYGGQKIVDEVLENMPISECMKRDLFFYDVSKDRIALALIRDRISKEYFGGILCRNCNNSFNFEVKKMNLQSIKSIEIISTEFLAKRLGKLSIKKT